MGWFSRYSALDQAKREDIAQINKIWNDKLRNALMYMPITSVDLKYKLSEIEGIVSTAEQRTKAYGGTFAMANDIKLKYDQLLKMHLEKEQKEAAAKKVQEEKEKKEEEHKKNICDQCINVLQQHGFKDVEVTWQFNSTINMKGTRNSFVHRLKYEEGMLNFLPSDTALLTLAESLGEIDLTCRNIRESQIRTFFSARNCNILSMVGATSSETMITFHGLCPGMHYIRYFFDLDEYERTIVGQPQSSIVTLPEDFDTMDGLQFEMFCAEIVRQNGYENVAVTSGSGDQGVDIIAYRDGVKYGIQCKCYSSPIGNKAVQEVFAGKTFYQCHVGIVMTNNYFTSAAIELAQRSGIILWDRDKLLKMINR